MTPMFEKGVSPGAGDMFENTGQSCDAPSRMLVPRAPYARGRSARRQGGRGDHESATRVMKASKSGQWFPDLQWQKIQDLIQAGIDEGATLPRRRHGTPRRPR